MKACHANRPQAGARPNEERALFICPECGSTEALVPSGIPKRIRGAGMRRGYTCTRCRFEIPAHLAERWGISSEQATKEWREVYRGIAQRVSAGACRPTASVPSGVNGRKG